MLSFGEELMSMDVISFAEINNRAAVSSELDQTERRAHVPDKCILRSWNNEPIFANGGSNKVSNVNPFLHYFKR